MSMRTYITVLKLGFRDSVTAYIRVGDRALSVVDCKLDVFHPTYNDTTSTPLEMQREKHIVCDARPNIHMKLRMKPS